MIPDKQLSVEDFLMFVLTLLALVERRIVHNYGQFLVALFMVNYFTHLEYRIKGNSWNL